MVGHGNPIGSKSDHPGTGSDSVPLMRRLIVLTAIALSLTAWVGVPAAHAAVVVDDITLTGEVECTTDKGGAPIYLITWTVDNTVGSPITIDTAEMSGQLTGSVSFEPTNLAIDESVSTRYSLDAPASGTVTLDITYTIDAVDPAASVTVTLDGTCGVAPTTTTTAAPPTTAPVVAAAAAAAVAPRFTG